jgi:formylglycine-generating enzyme required for sulfatase activity
VAHTLPIKTFFAMKVNQIRFCLLGALALHAAWPSPAIAADEVGPVTNAPTFAPTVPNKTPTPTNAPKGMVWVPGGEFSMGCKVPSEGVCTVATMNAVNDAQPIHPRFRESHGSHGLPTCFVSRNIPAKAGESYDMFS